MAKQHGEVAVIAAAQGRREGTLSDNEMQVVKEKYLTVLNVKDLKSVPLEQLQKILEPEHLFDRFAARKANQVGASKDFLAIKGQKFQIENETKTLDGNPTIGFKCMHYSVPESAGTVALTIIKKNQTEEFHFGVRTVEVHEGGRLQGKGTATPEKEYVQFDRSDFVMSKRETEKTVEI